MPELEFRPCGMKVHGCLGETLTSKRKKVKEDATLETYALLKRVCKQASLDAGMKARMALHQESLSEGSG